MADEETTVATLAEAKAFLQVSTDTDDTLITTLLTGVESTIEKNLRSIINAVEVTDYFDGGGKTLLLPNVPLDETTDVVIVDTFAEDDVVDEDLYRVVPTTGEIFPTGVFYTLYQNIYEEGVWPEGSRRFKVTYTGGLSVRADFVAVQNQIKIAEFLWLSDFYSHRQASSSSEKIDVFVEQYLLSEDMPARVKSALYSLLDTTSDI